jgi:hypothetical protein
LRRNVNVPGSLVLTNAIWDPSWPTAVGNVRDEFVVMAEHVYTLKFKSTVRFWSMHVPIERVVII